MVSVGMPVGMWQLAMCSWHVSWHASFDWWCLLICNSWYVTVGLWHYLPVPAGGMSVLIDDVSWYVAMSGGINRLIPSPTPSWPLPLPMISVTYQWYQSHKWCYVTQVIKLWKVKLLWKVCVEEKVGQNMDNMLEGCWWVRTSNRHIPSIYTKEMLELSQQVSNEMDDGADEGLLNCMFEFENTG